MRREVKLPLGRVDVVDVPKAELPLQELEPALGALEPLDAATLLLLGAERL